MEQTPSFIARTRSRPLKWAVALFVVLIVGLFAYLDGQSYLGWQHAVRETLGAREAVSDTLSQLKDAETGVRGFLFTGDPKFLEPYDQAQPALQADLVKLTGVGISNPAQAPSAARLRQLTQRELETLKALIATRNGDQFASAEAVELIQQGKSTMDEIRVEIAQMLVRADARLEEREHACMDAMLHVEVIVGLVILTGVMLAFAGLAGAQREAKQAVEVAARLARDIEAKEAAERQLRAQTRLQESILDNIGDGVFVASSDRRALVLNPTARRILPIIPGDPLPSDWSKVCEVYLPDGKTPFPRERGPLTRAFRGEPSDGIEMVARTRDGELRSYSVTTRPIHEGSEIVGAVAVYRDTTDKIRAAEAVAESEQRYRVLSQATFEGIAITVGGKVVDANDNFARWVGYGPHELSGMSGLELLPADERERVAKLAVHPEVVYESRLLRRDGSSFPIEIRSRSIELRGQQIRLAAMRDITERKRREAELEALSIRDALTGLYNRRGFMEVSRHELEAAARQRNSCAVFFADLNGMKLINDQLGHEAGDDAIRAAAQVLTRAFRPSDVIARLGGDEFSIFVAECDEQGVAPLCERIERAVVEANAKSNAEYRLSMSAGAAVWQPGTPPDIVELMRDADARMYEAKRARHLRASIRIVKSLPSSG